MAEVFLALHRSLQNVERLVAVKRVLPHLNEDPAFVDMFLAEARIAATLTHPNIAQIYDVGFADGRYFLAMEYVDGVTLRQLSSSLPALPIAQVVHVGIAVCSALGSAHEKLDIGGERMNIVHRDVSPQNILIDAAGYVKLVDFGIAKAAGTLDACTRPGTTKGKLSYMSPEQCLAGDVDHRSDLFCLGIVLWELTAGRRLFQRKSDFATMSSIVSDPIPRVRDVAPEVPEELEEIVMVALERDPARRFGTAAQMQRALEDFAVLKRLRPSTLDMAPLVASAAPAQRAARDALLEAVAAGDDAGLYALDIAVEPTVTSKSARPAARTTRRPGPRG